MLEEETGRQVEFKQPTYRSYGIARGDDVKVRSIKDYKDFKDCFVDPVSTSGYLFPSAGETKVVWCSPAIPGSPVAMRNALPEEVRKKISETFLTKLIKDWLVENGKCAQDEQCEATS